MNPNYLVDVVWEDTVVKAYDPKEKDPSKKLIGIFDNYAIASRVLGTSHSAVQNACQRKGKTFSPILNKELALRLAAKKDEEGTIGIRNYEVQRHSVSRTVLKEAC